MKSQSLNVHQRLLQAFEERGTKQRIARGEFLTRIGATEHTLYRILDGAVRAVYYTDDDEKTIRLGHEGSLINALSSFMTERPSEVAIQAIRETHVQCLPRSAAREIFDTSDDYAGFLEGLLVQQTERELDLLIDAPQKRLDRVLQRSPALFQHVPLKPACVPVNPNSSMPWPPSRANANPRPRSGPSILPTSSMPSRTKPDGVPWNAWNT
jgi:CRP-like cAMP-binding protein